MNERIAVDCRPDAAGWSCQVEVGEGTRATNHRVLVPLPDVDDLQPGATDPTALVEASFAFLLEREPKESILPEFDLGMIERYFPEYRTAIRERLPS